MKRTLLLLAVGVLGCRHLPQEHEVQEKGESFEGVGSGAKNALHIVGFTSSGAAAVFDGETGEIISVAAGGGGTPRDVAVDPWREGVWVFEENEEATGGEIRFCPLEAKSGGANGKTLLPILHPCEHSVWVDGIAVLLPAPEGLWVFEDGIGGQRWKVLQAGKVNSSASAPRPASVWMKGDRIEALSYGFQGNRLVKVGASFDGAAPEVQVEYDWGQPAGYPPTTRYARLSDDAGLLFDAASGNLTVCQVADGDIGLPRALDVGIQVSRVEAAQAVGTSALVLGTDALWIVRADDTGVELVSGLWLNGDVRSSPLFFSRDMLVVPNRAFVGTDRGVRSIVLENDGDAVGNGFLDEQFVGAELRGPLDAILASSS